MKVIFLTIFPNIIDVYLSTSMMNKAVNSNILEYEVIDIRQFSKDKHRKVDDYVYAGKGMLFIPGVVYEAIRYSKSKLQNSKVVYMSAKGRLLTKEVIEEYVNKDELVILCGRYEGVDERVVDDCVDDEICIGDYVITGGELAALVFVDAIVRQKGLLKDSSFCEESFSYEGGLLEYDQYTRPREFLGKAVPEVLLSGNHKKISEWRHFSSLKNTYEKRPDLLRKVKLSKKDIEFLVKLWWG
ncbi:MAG: tRNA (guanosine(37)-N1)-methyltransferase TrmD [Brevinematia bacterium]